MKFLVDLGFNDEDITQVESHTTKMLLKEFKTAKELVTVNVNFLKDLGVTNYKEVVINYSDMFLMDPSNFKSIFMKYDKDDLVEKIAKNVTIIEHL